MAARTQTNRIGLAALPNMHSDFADGGVSVAGYDLPIDMYCSVYKLPQPQHFRPKDKNMCKGWVQDGDIDQV